MTYEATPAPKLTVTLEYDYFRLASENGEWLNAILQSVGPGVGGSQELGNEIDAVVSYQPMSSVDVFGDRFASAEYRRELARVVSERALEAARARAKEDA